MDLTYYQVFFFFLCYFHTAALGPSTTVSLLFGRCTPDHNCNLINKYLGFFVESSFYEDGDMLRSLKLMWERQELTILTSSILEKLLTNMFTMTTVAESVSLAPEGLILASYTLGSISVSRILFSTCLEKIKSVPFLLNTRD